MPENVGDERMAGEWTQSLVIPSPKKDDLTQCQNCRIIGLVSHPSKIMLRVILNRLEPKTVELPAEEQAGLDQAGAQ